ncbi:hypothetical protein [Bradyrhizobium murdochi]|uniref:hypothetical protein n=1 Tax=Bradyrhizobium murdochi TaxID=1038859 RepID=UPI0012EB108F|nr:hypothetical protein [Bradyrhizobium murdochi]
MLGSSPVQKAKGVGTTATVDCSFPSATTSGNLIVLAFASNDYNGSPGAGWFQQTGMEQQTFHGGYLWFRISAGETTFSYTIGSATNSAWVITEWSGVDASPYDTSAGQFEQTTTETYTTPAITPSTGDHVLFAMMGGSLGGGADLTANSWGTWLNSFTAIDSQGSGGSGTNDLVGLAYRLVAGDGSTTYSSGATADIVLQSKSGLIISFKAAAPSTAALVGKATAAAALRSAFSGRTALQGASSLEIVASAGMNTQSSPTSAPILVSGTSTAFNTATTPKTASGITVQNGDVIVAHGMLETAAGGTINIATTAGSTVAWTLLEDVPGVSEPNQAYLRTWWTTASAPGTISVQFSKGAGSAAFGGIVKVYRNSSGVGAAEAAHNGDNASGLPSVSLTTTRDFSALDFACVDWFATSGTATFTSSAGTPATDLDVLSSGAYRVYSSHIDAGSAGSKTIGMSSPSTQRFVASAIEVLGLGQVGSLVARATVSSRGTSAFSGTTGLTGSAASSVNGRSTFSGRVPLAGRAAAAVAAGFAQSVALQFQTRFFPAMRGTLTTVVSLGSSAGSATMLRMRGEATARAALAARVASAAQSTAAGGGSASLSGMAKIASSAKNTFSGRVVLAIQTRFLPAMRGALNAVSVPTSIALSSATAIVGRARASIVGRASLEARSNVSSRATGSLSAIAALSSRTAAKAMGAASVAARTALATAATVRTAINGSMVGRVALLGRAAMATASRAIVPGTLVELIARATTAVKTIGRASAGTSLTGKSALQVQAAAQPPRLTAFMAAFTAVVARARAGTSATADFAAAARTKIAVSARSTFSGVVNLGASVKATTAARLSEPFLPLAARAVMRTSARALLFILRPIIPVPVSPRSGRLGRLRQSLEKAFGEEFDINPMTAAVDVNSRVLPDISRDPKIDVIGIWQGPATSRAPIARGSMSDDKAHNWNVSFPSVRFDDAAIAGVRRGDKLTRKLDGAVYIIERVVPDGFGRTTVQLTSRKRETVN